MIKRAVVTRNRDASLLSRSGSHVRAADGVAKEGNAIFLAKGVTFRGVFLIDVIYFTKCAGFQTPYHMFCIHVVVVMYIPFETTTLEDLCP